MDFQSKIKNFIGGVNRATQNAGNFFTKEVPQSIGYLGNTISQNVQALQKSPKFAQQFPKIIGQGLNQATNQVYGNNLFSDALKRFIVPGIENTAGALTTGFTNKNLYQKAGDIAKGVGSVVTPGAAITGSAFNAGFNTLGNLKDNKPLTTNLDQSMRQGYDFGATLGPLGKFVGMTPGINKISNLVPGSGAVSSLAGNALQGATKEFLTGTAYGLTEGQNLPQAAFTGASFAPFGILHGIKGGEGLKLNKSNVNIEKLKISPKDQNIITTILERKVNNVDNADYAIRFKNIDDEQLRMMAEQYIGKTYANTVPVDQIAQDLLDIVKRNQGGKQFQLPQMGLIENQPQKVGDILKKQGMVGKTIKPDGKLRGFPETVNQTIDTPKPVADAAIENPSNYYIPITNKQTVKIVKSTILNKGEDYALNIARNGQDTNANATAIMLIDKYLKKGEYEKANQLISEVSPRFTQQGQGIQILSLYGRLTPTGATKYAQKLIDKANEGRSVGKKIKLTSENIQKISEAAKRIEKFPEGSRDRIVATQQLMKEITDPIPVSLGQKIATIQTIMQLFNPKTAIRNVLGNAIFGTLENASDVVGTGIDVATSIFTRKRTKTLPSLTSQAKGLGKGFKEGTSDAIQGIDTSGGIGTQFDLPVQTFKGKLNPLTYLEKAMNIELRAPDRAAYSAAYEGSLNNQMRAAKVNTATLEMMQQAHLDGMYRTFQDNSRLAQVFGGAKKLLNKIGTPDGKFGLGDFILKYPKTPANILSRGLDYSPAGFIKGLYEATKPIISGQEFNQKAFVEALSRGMLGTGLIAGGYMLAKNGVITGRPAKDKDIAAVESEQGGGPFRINVDALKRFVLQGGSTQSNKVGDLVVSFDWAQPTSLVLAMGANLNINPKGQDAFTTSIEQLDAGVSTLTQQSLVKGVTDFTKDVGSYGPARALTNAGLGAPSSFIPSLSNQTVQLTDNTSRETYDPSALKQAYNKTIARIPGAEKQLPEKVTVFGKTKERFQNGSNNVFNVLFNPAFVSRIKENPAAKEVLDIYQRSGETQQAPRLVDRTIKINGENKALTPNEYNDYQRYVGTKAEFAISQFASDPLYQSMSDDQKAKFIAGILTDINSAAKIELFSNSPKNIDSGTKLVLGGAYSRASSKANTILTKEGNLSVVDMNFSVTPPKLTGISELDKKLISKYNGELTKKANDIVALYEAGKLSKEEAGRLLTRLRTSKLGSGKKGRKAKMVNFAKAAKYKPMKSITLKTKKPKKFVAKSLKTPALKQFTLKGKQFSLKA